MVSSVSVLNKHLLLSQHFSGQNWLSAYSCVNLWASGCALFSSETLKVSWWNCGFSFDNPSLVFSCGICKDEQYAISYIMTLKVKKKTQTHKLTKQSKKICCCWNEILKLAIVIEHLSRQIELNWDSVELCCQKDFICIDAFFMEVYFALCCFWCLNVFSKWDKKFQNRPSWLPSY